MPIYGCDSSSLVYQPQVSLFNPKVGRMIPSDGEEFVNHEFKSMPNIWSAKTDYTHTSVNRKSLELENVLGKMD